MYFTLTNFISNELTEAISHIILCFVRFLHQEDEAGPPLFVVRNSAPAIVTIPTSHHKQLALVCTYQLVYGYSAVTHVTRFIYGE